MQVHIVDHPLAQVRLTALRDEGTGAAGFRAALRELTAMLVYEATRGIGCEPVEVRTPVGECTGARLVTPPLLVPVLRAGLGMLEAAQALLPESAAGFVGLVRDERTFTPTPYLVALPEELSTRPVWVLDPMLATGGSLAHTVGLLRQRGAVDITVLCVVAAPEGVATLGEAAPGARLFTAAIDDGLNDDAYIVPGLGDAGDRQYGPRPPVG